MLLTFAIQLSACTLLALAYKTSRARLWPDVNPSDFRATVKLAEDQPPFNIPPLQSPINIRASKTTLRRLPPLRFHDLLSPDVLVDMKNTGYTAEFEIDHDSSAWPRVTGGPLEAHGEYVFQNLHVHWGYKDILGGEHKINSRRFAIEGHCVHYNVKYGSFEEAAKHEDGLAVIAFFLKAGRRDNPRIEEVVRLLPNITHPGSMIRVRAGEVLGFFAHIGQPRHYFTYPGSLTTPPYTENVIWIVYPDPMPVSSRQVEAFRGLLRDDMSKIKQNTRGIQPFNERPLIFAV